MKYYYLFVLIFGIAPSTHNRSESELNKEQKQIESLIINAQGEEKGVTNKDDGLMANTPYYIGSIYDQVTPIIESDQFVMPVLKFGIPGKEPEYADDNESLRLGLYTLGNRKAVIPKGRHALSSIRLQNKLAKDGKKNELQKQDMI
jgi:hypothetical protein